MKHDEIEYVKQTRRAIKTRLFYKKKSNAYNKFLNRYFKYFGNSTIDILIQPVGSKEDIDSLPEYAILAVSLRINYSYISTWFSTFLYQYFGSRDIVPWSQKARGQLEVYWIFSNLKKIPVCSRHVFGFKDIDFSFIKQRVRFFYCYSGKVLKKNISGQM